MLVVVLMYSFLKITMQVARLPSTPSTRNSLEWRYLDHTQLLEEYYLIQNFFSQIVQLPVYHSEGDQGGVLQVLLAQPGPDELARGNLLNREGGEVLSCQKKML